MIPPICIMTPSGVFARRLEDATFNRSPSETFYFFIFLFIIYYLFLYF